MKRIFKSAVSLLMAASLACAGLNPSFDMSEPIVTIIEDTLGETAAGIVADSMGTVETVYAATATPAPTQTPLFPDMTLMFKGIGANYADQSVIVFNPSDLSGTKNNMKLSVTTDKNVLPANCKVEWHSLDIDKMVIEIAEDPSDSYGIIITANSPGFAALRADVTYTDENNKSYVYTMLCTIRVPLELLKTGEHVEKAVYSSNDYLKYDNGELGYYNESEIVQKRGDVAETTSGKRILQLSTSDESELYSHFFVKFRYVNYDSSLTWNSTEEEIKALVDAGKLTMFAEWTSSDDNIVEVSEYGLIKAKSAGQATVTAKITDADGNKQEYSFEVLVNPAAKLKTDTSEPKTGTDTTLGPDFYSSVPYSYSTRIAQGRSFTIVTNIMDVSDSSNVTWTLYRRAGNAKYEIPIKDNEYMDLEFKDNNIINVTNAQAGIYRLDGTIKSDIVGCNKVVQIRIIVPIVAVNTDTVYMSVGDTYDFAENSNVDIKTQIGDIKYDTEYLKWTGDSAGNKSFLAIKATPDTMTDIKFSYILEPASGSDDKTSIYGSTELKELEVAELEKLSGFDYYNTSGGVNTFTVKVAIVDDISINTKKATVAVGATLPLGVDTSEMFSKITWTTSNGSIATVDEYGIVTGVSAGTATIYASQVINGVTKTVSCEVTVIPSITGIELSATTDTIDVGTNLTIHAKVNPDTDLATLYWSVSDPEIVSITESGKLYATITGLKGGMAVVYAINKDNVITASYTVYVQEPIESISLSETEVIRPYKKGDYFHLYATVLPVSATESEIVWKSMDTSVVTVDEHGKVTIVGYGSTSVMVSSKGNSNVAAWCKVTITKTVTGIKLDDSSRDMYVGETYRLSYTISPADASNAAVTWSSTNTQVATVDSTGLVTAKSVGTTIIMAKTTDGGYIAMCTINVERTATAVKLDVTSLTLNVGDYYYLETALTPKDATESTIVFESSDPSVAVVSKRGKITGKKAGTCLVFAKTKSGSMAYCNVTVNQGVEGISFDVKEVVMNVGEELELTPVFTPENATNKNLIWESSKPEVAFVDEEGEVEALAGGITVVTATAEDGGYVAHCIITVNEFVTELKLSENSYRLGLGRSHRLTATINAETATNKEVTWKTSDSSIVTVDKNGVIKGVAYGTATITCTAVDGSGAEDYCTVEVVKLVTDIELNETYITIVKGNSFTLKATVTPDDATYTKPVFTSNDTTIAIVNSKGVITALNAGDCIITVEADDSSGISALCYVHVIEPVPATGITLQETSIVMAPGEKRTVGITLKPVTSTDTYTWSCDNTAIVSVDEETGVITAKELGVANVTVMTESGQKAVIKVYVVGLSRSYVELQQYTALLLKLEVDGSESGNLNVRWDVDNQEIATVVNGRVTARALGTTTVYAVVNGRRLACTVKVVKIK